MMQYDIYISYIFFIFIIELCMFHIYNQVLTNYIRVDYTHSNFISVILNVVLYIKRCIINLNIYIFFVYF